MESELGNIFLQIDIADRFLAATECSSVTVILGVLAVVLFLIVIKQYKRNTALSDHIIQADKNNAVVMTEVKNILGNVLTDDKTNADKILTAIENLEKHVG